MQTLRERCDECGFHIQITHGPTPEAAEEALRLLDLPILDGVGLVAMDREAGARKLAMEMGFWHPSGGTPTIREVRPAFDAILTACGIIPVDEVVEGCVYTDGEHDSEWLLLAPPDSTRDGVVWDSTMLGKENERVTITITRKEGE